MQDSPIVRRLLAPMPARARYWFQHAAYEASVAKLAALEERLDDEDMEDAIAAIATDREDSPDYWAATHRFVAPKPATARRTTRQPIGCVCCGRMRPGFPMADHRTA